MHETARRLLTAVVIVIASIGSAATSSPERVGPHAATSARVRLDGDAPISTHAIAVTVTQEALDAPDGFDATLFLHACIAVDPDAADSPCAEVAEDEERADVEDAPLVRISLGRELSTVERVNPERIPASLGTIGFGADDWFPNGFSQGIRGVELPELAVLEDGSATDTVTMTIELIGDEPQVVVLDALLEVGFVGRYDTTVGGIAVDESVPGAEASMVIK